MYYDPYTMTLLEPVQEGDILKFKSRKTGVSYDAEPEHTLLAQGTESEININEKYKHLIRSAPYDPTNPMAKTGGCPKCGRVLLRYTRLGENKEVIYTCLCGYIGKNLK